MSPFRRLIYAATKQMSSRGFIALVDQAVASGTNFLTGIILGRVLLKQDFGIYMLGFSIVLFINNIQGALITTPYAIYSPRLQGHENASYTGSTLLHQMGLSLAAIFFLLIGGVATSLGVGPTGLGSVVWALAGVIALISLREYGRQVCFARRWMAIALWLDLGVAIVQIGGLLLLSHFGSLSPSGAFLMIGLACGLPSIGWLLSVRGQLLLRLADANLALKHNWSSSRFLLAGNLMYLASYQVYPWLLAAFHGPAETGMFSACMGVLFIANPFLIGMSNFFTPEMAHAFADGRLEELRRIVVKGTILFAVLMGSFCLAIVFWGGRIVVLFYGSKYTGTGLIVAILALSQLASALTFPVNSALLAVERTDAYFKSYFVPLVVTLTIGIWLVRDFGSAGAACALLGCNIIGSAFRCVVFRRQLCCLRPFRAHAGDA